MKTILIIGAGKAQVPLIRAAKKENYRTVVCDIDPNAPGVSLAAEYYKVSTKDRKSLFEVAQKKNINGIVANSEYAMCDVAFIANNLGLVGNSERAISILSSKSKFRELQKAAGLFAPAFIYGDAVEHLADGLLHFPVVIKPDMSSGQRGAEIVQALDDGNLIKRSVTDCAKISRNAEVIIEEYVSGPTCVAIEGEVFVHKGKILWDGLFLSLRSKFAPMIPMTYVFPLKEKERRLAWVQDALTKAFRAADVAHGEYNIEMFFTDNEEPFIIEINPRQGGNDLPKYVQQHCGIDYYRLLVTTAMGDDDYWNSLKNYERKNNYIVHHMLYPREKGYFKGLQIDDPLLKHVYNQLLYIEVGDKVEPTVDGASSIGYVDLKFTNVEEQLNASFNIEELIKIVVEPK